MKSEAPVKRIAGIDLGTNSFHAVIADIFEDGHFELVDSLKEMVFLAEAGLGSDISEESMKRGLNALRIINQLCEGQNVESIHAYATSAIREAKNGGEFIQRVIDEIGIKVNAISGLLEAELISLGVRNGVRLENSPSLLVDIGGGSVEFIIADHEKTHFLTSHKIGVARLRADFVDADPPTAKQIREMEQFILSEIEDVRVALVQHPCAEIIGSSGTMQAVAALLALRGKGKEKIDLTSIPLNEFRFTRQEFESLAGSLLKMNRKKRLRIVGLDEKRVDLILPGIILIGTLLKELKVDLVRISIQALREGIIIRAIQKEFFRKKDPLPLGDPRRRSVMTLAEKCNWHREHSLQVCRLALKIFDELREEIGADESDRELLEFATILHDIGYHVSHNSHHKHALYLILNADLRGFQEDEVQIMGHVARYHRRSVPSKRHTLFNELKKPVKERIRTLAGILRVADGLDRSHYQNVKELSVESNPDKIVLRIRTQSDPELEIWGAMRKAQLLESQLRKSVEIIEA